MKKIIIDTNIWYNISNEEINNLTENYNLVIPIIVLNEIYTSPNLFLSKEKFESARKAIISIINNIDKIKFIELNPFEFMLNEIYTDIKPYSSVDFYLKEFQAISKLNFEDVKDNYVKRFDISRLTNFINETSFDYKKIINLNLSSKEKFKKFDTINNTKSLIIKYANDDLETINKLYPKISGLNTIKFELLIKTFDSLLREVSKSNMKIKNNDWVDIFILTYVNENDLFWTREKPKLKLIKDIKLEKYLFDNNPQL